MPRTLSRRAARPLLSNKKLTVKMASRRRDRAWTGLFACSGSVDMVNWLDIGDCVWRKVKALINVKELTDKWRQNATMSPSDSIVQVAKYLQ
jgi:hypothetical protein